MRFDAKGWLDEAIEIDYLNKSMNRQGYKITHIVNHGTAGGSSAQNIGTYFRDSNVQSSAHFVIGQDGTIIQGIPCSLATWANGPLTNGHASFLPNVNGNLYTVSIEHVKAHTDNSDALTNIQAQKSFELINCLCDTYDIPKRAGDANGGILSHADFDPITRARCPGPYPWEGLWAYLKGGHEMGGVPHGWKYDQNAKVLTAPNGVQIVRGFCQYVLANNWDHGNVPQGAEYGANPAILHRPDLGAGTRQLTRDGLLWWTQAKGIVYEAYMGLELDAAFKEISRLQTQATQKS